MSTGIPLAESPLHARGSAQALLSTLYAIILFLNDPATTEISTLSLHDALPICHNGSVVILAIDTSKSKKDPWIVIERQYRHAANQFLWELPAGKLEAGADPGR